MSKKNTTHSKIIFAVLTPILILFVASTKAIAIPNDIVFPVLGAARYSNDFNSPRSDGPHNATDIFANKMHHVVSATNGTVVYVAYPQPSWGYMIGIRDDEGYRYNYIHLNNDTPGTDDGQGGGNTAYAPDIRTGARVVKGQHIGWVGDSGNAESTPPHLHFEIIDPNGNPVNPYDYLRNAQIIPRAIDYPALANEVLPYGSTFYGGGNVAAGNFDSDAQSEFITGTGMGGGPHVKIMDTDRTYIAMGFLAYDEGFRGGVDVAAGDIDGDGIDEIITGAGPSGGPHINIFRVNGSHARQGFFAYDDGFRGGVRVAAGDIDGDGIDEIITGTGTGGGPHVKIFKSDGTLIRDFFAYDGGFRGGVDVTAADVSGDNKAEIVTGAGPGGGPHVKIFSAVGSQIGDFFPYTEGFRGGVRVSAGNVRTQSAKSEIAIMPATQGGPHVQLYSGNGTAITGRNYLEQWSRDAYDIAAGNDASWAIAGVSRRTSVREAID